MNSGRFVGHKGNEQWVWLALDRESRRIVGGHVGDHNRQGTEALWQLLPPFYRQCAVCLAT